MASEVNLQPATTPEQRKPLLERAAKIVRDQLRDVPRCGDRMKAYLERTAQARLKYITAAQWEAILSGLEKMSAQDVAQLIGAEPIPTSIPTRPIYFARKVCARRLRAGLLCDQCGNRTEGRKLQLWKFCPRCGAPVERRQK